MIPITRHQLMCWINARVIFASSWKEYTHVNMCSGKRLSDGFYRDRSTSMTWESKQQQKKTERRRGGFFFFFWIARELLVTWSETHVDLTAHLDPTPPTLIHLPPSSLSLIVVARVWRNWRHSCSWWWISPAGLVWLELVFYSFHLHQHPSPPLRPSFSWQALISIPNHWQTWGFEMPHSAPYGM